MKRIFVITIAVAILLSSGIFCIPALADMYGDFTYVISDEKAVITGYSGSAQELEIPAYISGYPVTEIGEEAFSECAGLYRVIIPEDVSVLGIRAFSGCKELVSVELPESLVCIWQYAFSNCKSLTNISIPKNVEILANYAFFNCSALTDITIPATVTNIGNFAFFECSSLTHVIIEEGVQSIGMSAFQMTGLTDIVIPSSVADLSSSAFVSCENLKNIYVHKDNPYYTSVDGALFNKEKTKLIKVPEARTGVYVVPDGVVTIGYEAFRYSTGITNIILPSSLYQIESFAFAFSGLKEIVLPDGVAVVDPFAFAQCKQLTAIMIPNSVTELYLHWSDELPEMIFCYQDSYAHQYLSQNGFSYQILDPAIVSERYSVSDGLISYISAGTTVGDLLSEIEKSYDVRLFAGDRLLEYNAVVGTGTQLRRISGGQVLCVVTAVVLSDINGDGRTSIADVTAAAKYALTSVVDPVYEKAGDLNGDGHISLSDVLLIARQVLEQ